MKEFLYLLFYVDSDCNTKREASDLSSTFYNNRIYFGDKKTYALNYGYSYLEIPYTSIANDYYKELILNKISSGMEDKFESKS